MNSRRFIIQSVRPLARCRHAGLKTSTVAQAPRPKSNRRYLGSYFGAGSMTPPPCRRRMVQIASATIRAPPSTANIHRCLPTCS